MIRSCVAVKEIVKEVPIINEIIENDKEEKELLKQMKEDEIYLKELYLSSNICQKEWVKEYRDIEIKFKEYKYKGKYKEINKLLDNYKAYGKRIEEISITIDKSNYEKGIYELEGLKEIAKKCEEELTGLYNKYY